MQQCVQFAVEGNLGVAPVTHRDDDLVNQRPDGFTGCRDRARVIERLHQIGNPVPVYVGQTGMQIWEFGGFCAEKIFEIILLVFQLKQQLMHRGNICAIGNRQDNAVDLLPDLGQFLLLDIITLVFLALKPVGFLLHLRDHLMDQIRVEQFVFEPRQNPFFDFQPFDGSPLITGAALGSVEAAIAILTDDRIAPAAAVAGQEAGQQMFGAMGGVHRGGISCHPAPVTPESRNISLHCRRDNCRVIGGVEGEG